MKFRSCGASMPSTISAEEIDWLVNTRAHPVDMVFTRLCGLVPLYVLGPGAADGEHSGFGTGAVRARRYRMGLLHTLQCALAFRPAGVAPIVPRLPPLASHQRWAGSPQQELRRHAALGGQVFRHLLPAQEAVAGEVRNQFAGSSRLGGPTAPTTTRPLGRGGAKSVKSACLIIGLVVRLNAATSAAEYTPFGLGAIAQTIRY